MSTERTAARHHSASLLMDLIPPCCTQLSESGHRPSCMQIAKSSHHETNFKRESRKKNTSTESPSSSNYCQKGQTSVLLSLMLHALSFHTEILFFSLWPFLKQERLIRKGGSRQPLAGGVAKYCIRAHALQCALPYVQLCWETFWNTKRGMWIL